MPTNTNTASRPVLYLLQDEDLCIALSCLGCLADGRTSQLGRVESHRPTVQGLLPTTCQRQMILAAKLVPNSFYKSPSSPASVFRAAGDLVGRIQNKATGCLVAKDLCAASQLDALAPSQFSLAAMFGHPCLAHCWQTPLALW